MLNTKLIQLEKEFKEILERDKENENNLNYQESDFYDSIDSFIEFLVGKLIEEEKSKENLISAILRKKLEERFKPVVNQILKNGFYQELFDENLTLIETRIRKSDVEELITALEDIDEIEHYELLQLSDQLFLYMNKEKINYILC